MQSYLYISYKCNCNCFFCASDQTNVFIENCEVSLEEAKKFISKSPNRDNLIISGGEPTIHKDIIEIIKYAKNYFKKVSIMTNGLRLANLAFLEEIIDAGVDCFFIPVYSAERNIYNNIVGNKQAFDCFIQGLSNLNDIILKTKIEVNLKLLLAKFTYKTNPQLIDYIAQNFKNIKNLSLYGFHIGSKALKRANECIMNYNDSRPYNDSTINKLLKYGYNFHICEIPLCAFSNEIIYYLLEFGKIAYTDEKYLKRPDWNVVITSPSVYIPKECKNCALEELCPKINSKNASNFDLGIRSIPFSD